MLETVDLIIKASWLLPILPNEIITANQAVVIKNGNIVAIIDYHEVDLLYSASETVVLDNHVLMPGLINTHTHAAMSLMRGIADDLPLMQWLEQHIWPSEQKVLSNKFVKEGTLIACAEMLSGGTTTFNDMYFYPESIATAALQMGMRSSIGLVVLEFATQYANDADAYIAQGTEVRDTFKSEGLISFQFAPHAPYTVSDKSFEKIAILSEQIDIGIHTHLHETKMEIAQSIKKHGITPLNRIANLGLLSSRISFAHCVHLSHSEQQLLAEYGCHIAHCPTSNLKLASGIAPIDACLKSGINIGLGTDGAASNNRLDMFAEMRLAALLAKGTTLDATAISAYKALEMATINGAKSLGLEHKIGSIECGKLADLIAVDLGALTLKPCYDIASHLVYVADRHNVSHTWVNGELRYHRAQSQNGNFSGIEPQEIESIVQHWQKSLMNRQH
jgi:5-methylthioadenosine/S-adenosylhomocysteine deaminase